MAPLSWPDIERAVARRPPEIIGEDGVARAAVALVLRERHGCIETLFIRRADHPRDPWSGQMAFPGGRAELADPDLAATARRETLEETGLDLASGGTCLGRLDEIEAMARMQRMGLVISPFVYRFDGPGDAAASAEVRSVHWIPLSLLLNPTTRSVHPYTHRGVTLRFPCLRIDDDVVIWGLTYRMFEGLAGRLSDPGAERAPAS